MQPWPGEVLEERAGEIAAGFAALVTRQAAWRPSTMSSIKVATFKPICPAWFSRSGTDSAS